jgi:hypothetical protein
MLRKKGVHFAACRTQFAKGHSGVRGDTSDRRQLAGTFKERAQHCRDVDIAVRFHRDQGHGRQIAIARIGDDAKRRKGQSMPLGRAGSDMRLHINDDCAGRRVHGLLGFGPINQPVDTGHIGNDCAGKRQG